MFHLPESFSLTAARKLFLADDADSLAAILDRSGDAVAFLDTAIPSRNPCAPPKSISVVLVAKPLLLMFMFGAERCCQLALNLLSFAQLLGIREDAGTVLHALVIGCHRGLRPYAVFDAVLSAVLRRCPPEELRELNECSGHLGLRAVELAVRLDQFRLAERLLCSGVLRKVGHQVCGPEMTLTFELGEYALEAKGSRYLVSPSALLSEDLSLARLKKIKESNILRPQSIFSQWAALTSKRVCKIGIYNLIFMIFTLLLLVFSGHAFTKKQLVSICHSSNHINITSDDVIWEYVTIFLSSLIVGLNLSSGFSVSYFISMYRRIGCEIPLRELQVFRMIAHYCVLSFVAAVAISIWAFSLWIPQAFCGPSGYYCLSTAIIVVNLYFVYQAMYDCQLVRYLGQFVTNLFDIALHFAPFIVFYILIIFVFSRTFENIRALQTFRQQGNSTAPPHDKNLFSGLSSAAYSTFRMSLHIMDLSRESTDPVMRIAHCSFVLLLPFITFNYIIGVISAQLSAMVEVREQKTVLHRQLLSIFTSVEATMTNGITAKLKRKPKPTYITVCVPVTDVCVRQEASREERS